MAAWLFYAAPASWAGEPASPQTKTGKALSYSHFEDPEKPWSIHVVKLERASPDYEWQTTVVGNPSGGLSTLLDQLKGLPAALGRPVAAVNGDFWKDGQGYDGDPGGVQIHSGEIVSGPGEKTCFWIDPAGHPQATNVLSRFQITWPNGAVTPFGLNEHCSNEGAVLFTPAIGKSTRTSGGREIVLEQDGDHAWLPLRAGENYSARVREVRDAGSTALASNVMVLALGPQLLAQAPKIERGARLRISTATFPSLSGVKVAIGGGPILVRGGKAVSFNGTSPRAPRTAIGWNSKYIFLVVVDGRQRSLSIGMDFPELAEYLVKLGCEEAMNLDGGGSTTMWVHGQVVNSPSQGGVRPIANGLVVVKKDKPANH